MSNEIPNNSVDGLFGLCHDYIMSKKTPPSLTALIDASIEAEEFDSAEELIKETHSRLEDPETQKVICNVWLKRQLKLADTEGGEHSVEEVLGETRAELSAMKSAK